MQTHTRKKIHRRRCPSPFSLSFLVVLRKFCALLETEGERGMKMMHRVRVEWK